VVHLSKVQFEDGQWRQPGRCQKLIRRPGDWLTDDAVLLKVVLCVIVDCCILDPVAASFVCALTVSKLSLNPWNDLIDVA